MITYVWILDFVNFSRKKEGEYDIDINYSWLPPNY